MRESHLQWVQYGTTMKLLEYVVGFQLKDFRKMATALVKAVGVQFLQRVGVS